MLRQQQEELVRLKQSFVIETNAASTRDYTLFSALKAAGYRVELRYVGLKSVALCLERVAEGGHNVSAAFVEQRYYNSLSLLKTNYWIFDHLQLHDNSDTEPEELADILPGLSLRQLRPLPEWARTVTAHMVRIEAIYAKLPKA